MLAAEATLRAALAAKGLRYVGIRGNPHSKVLLLGEAPGEKEDAKGLPFIGPSGFLLDNMLQEAGFSPSETWFSNPYKTRPPDNRMDRLHELGVPHSLFHNQFFEELNAYKPTIIIACGKTGTQLLCPETKPKYEKKDDKKEGGLGNWRGSLLISPLLNWPHYVIPCYHPAYTLRNYEEREITIFILTRAYEEYMFWKKHGVLQPLPARSIITSPSYDIAHDFLNRCILSPDPISSDIELLKRKVPYTIAFALSPSIAMSLSFWNYSTIELRVLWRLMDKILSTKRHVGQNWTTFDSHWVRALGFSDNLSLVDDTLIMHHILWPELPHKLQFIGMQYSRQPYWKEEGKSWSAKEGLDKLMHYNALDAMVTYEAFIAMKEELRERKN
jgi:uracil-DNA glycosylase family 4